ncbi:MAG TPA: RHS repeat-associated core domain-containing protein, partial [Candidatus Saccharimonadales bacterium]|nr:RHS repeat-associated core domain-containing protein [Candidatus Saccharimonadales bacterium]
MRSRDTVSYKALASLLVMLAYLVVGVVYAQQSSTVTTVTYIYTDAQGNVIAKADDQGNIIARYTYRPYGTQQSGPTNTGPGYTGHVHDPDTGLVYMQQRYYDPVVGRFISPDPVTPAPGNVFNFNRYVYANNNPLRYTDPDGRSVTCDAN